MGRPSPAVPSSIAATSPNGSSPGATLSPSPRPVPRRTSTGQTSSIPVPRRLTVSRSTGSRLPSRATTCCSAGLTSACGASRTRPREVQQEWMRMQGPWTPELVADLPHVGRAYDCVVFVTYLYWTTYAGLRAIGGSMPTLLHPTAHDEPPLRMSIFEEVFRLPDAFAFLTPEESELVARRFPGVPGVSRRDRHRPRQGGRRRRVPAPIRAR